MSFETLFKGFSPPELNPDFGLLNEAFSSKAEAVEDVREKLNKRLEGNVSGPIVPLTVEEAIEQAKQIDAATVQVKEALNRLNSISNSLELQLSEENRKGCKLDISKRRALRTATRQLYGKAKDAITYEMYKELKALKAKLDKENTEEYVKGDWSNS
jgi:hypothetical protein